MHCTREGHVSQSARATAKLRALALWKTALTAWPSISLAQHFLHHAARAYFLALCEALAICCEISAAFYPRYFCVCSRARTILHG